MATNSMKLKTAQLFDLNQAMTGFVYVSTNNYRKFKNLNSNIEPVYIKLFNFIFTLGEAPQATDEQVALGKYPRQFLKLSFSDTIDVALYKVAKDQVFTLSSISIEIDAITLYGQGVIQPDQKDLEVLLRKNFKNFFLQPGHIYVFDYQGNQLLFTVLKTQLTDIGSAKQTNSLNQPGLLADETDFEISAKQTNNFRLKSSEGKIQNIFRPDFKFEDMGVGGLDRELSDIFRRAFASRRFPPSVLQKYGISHVKGVLLFGPPGTGKTLIARQLSKALRSKEPKIVNGPSIMSKFVGESEKNIRDLFEDASTDQKRLGDDSPLHIIIFDEIDAICKQRGTVNSGTGVHDSMVNQLLSMIDGVDALNNILVIGMTNRKDLIDEAVLRPGRFEVHIEVTLPDEKGRQDIFKIHTAKMVSNNLMGRDVDLGDLARDTKNYTGAEIEAVVKSASSYAFNRGTNLTDFTKQASISVENCKVEMQDFKNALNEVKPQFGVDTDKFEVFTRQNLYNYGKRYEEIRRVLNNSFLQVKNGKNSQLLSVLLEGETGTGKTSIAAKAALESGFPYLKLISPETYVGYTDIGKINSIVKIFEDAYRSPLSCIVIDNLERLIEYIDMGARFSNTVLQALLVLIKKLPKNPEHRMLIIGTTSCASTLKDLDIVGCFNNIVNVPSLKTEEEFKSVLSNKDFNITTDDIKKICAYLQKEGRKLSIKKLLLIIDMALRDSKILKFENFKECLEELVDFGANQF